MVTKTLYYLILPISLLPLLINVFVLNKEKNYYLFTIANGFIWGYLWALFLFYTCLRFIHTYVNVVYFIFVIIFILISITSNYSNKHTISIGMCFFGGFLISKGIDVLIGGFPSEFIIIDLIEKKEFSQIDEIGNWKIYVYLGSWLVHFLVFSSLNHRKLVNSDIELYNDYVNSMIGITE